MVTRAKLMALAVGGVIMVAGCDSLTDNSFSGDEHGRLSIVGNGPAALDADTTGATFNIGNIAVSETGDAWTGITDGPVSLVIAQDSSSELVLKDLPSGEYHGVKVELAQGFHVELADGTSHDLEYPDVLMYIQGGMYRWSSADNGFPETNEYFLFTTLNGTLTAPIVVEPNETSSLVIFFEPTSVTGGGIGLAARAVFSGFSP